MSKSATEEFRKHFNNRDTLDARKWWRTAQPVILDEVKKQLNNESNELIVLAEYLASNVLTDQLDFEIHSFLKDTYGFFGKYQNSWDVILDKFGGDVTEWFPYYRRVIPIPTFPLKLKFVIAPRVSREWQPSEMKELHDILAIHVRHFEDSVGVPLCEHYYRVEDAILAGLQQASEVSFDQFWKHSNVGTRDPREIKSFRTLASRLSVILPERIENLREQLIPDFESEEAFGEAIRSTVEHCTERWSTGVFWNRRDFLYSFVYSIWCKLGSNRWDISELFLKKHHLAKPIPFDIVEVALNNRISRLWRDAENTLRDQKGLPRVGEGWISESKLVARLREAFPKEKILTQASPSWLGRLRFDAYFPEHNIAVEYQGPQHSEALTIFGGEAGLVTTQARDDIKRQLSAKHGCRLVEVLPDYDVAQLLVQLKEMLSGRRSNVPTGPVRVQTIARQTKDRGTKLAMPKRRALGAHDVRGCARHGTGELIRSLSKEGTNFAALQKKQGGSLLFIAASGGNLDTLRALLDVGLDVNAENCERTTALACLCSRVLEPNLDAVRMILDAGADLTKCNLKGYDIFGGSPYAPPIIAAAIKANIPLATLLLEFGANTNIDNCASRFTPFLAACGQDHRNLPGSDKRLEMLRWLLKHGADPLAKNGRGQSAFDIACERARGDRIDYALFDFLMTLKVPVGACRLYGLEHEYKITRAQKIKRILDYATIAKQKDKRR